MLQVTTTSAKVFESDVSPTKVLLQRCVLTAEALALRFRSSLTQKAGCNCLVINSDNMKVIETMKKRSAGEASAVFDDCYFLACISSLSLVLNIVIGKRI